MRHFFGYDIEGRVRSVDTYGPEGWPVCECDCCTPGNDGLLNPNCTMPRCANLRATYAKHAPYVVGWVLYNCNCPHGAHHIRECPCVKDFPGNNYVDTVNKVYVPKPVLSVYLDSDLLTNRTAISRPPGATAVLKLVVPGIPDGTSVRLIQRGVADIVEEDEFEMTFSGGEATKTLVAPAQGTKGGLVVVPAKYVRPFTVVLRGYAAPP